MQKFFAEYFERLQNCHNDILREVEGLNPAVLDWTPGPEMNSISVLVFHLTGAARFWIGDVAVQEPSNRVRDEEFKVEGLNSDALKKRVEDTLEYSRGALDKMILQDLELVRTLPDGRQFTVAWALLHALEHASEHLGQIQLTRQLWEQKNRNA